MSGAGGLGLYNAVKPQGRRLFRRSLLTANLPVTLRQSRPRTHRSMKPQCTAIVENPLTAGVKSNGTGGYQHIYKELNTGDSLAKEYADDTAAAPKNRRAGDALCTASAAAEPQTASSAAQLGSIVSNAHLFCLQSRHVHFALHAWPTVSPASFG